MNETCMKHALNMPDIGGCPYCRIDELEEQNERDRCHGRDFIRLWKEGKERIAELENRLAHKQEQYVQLTYEVLGLKQQLYRYQGGFEVDGFSVGGVSISLDKPIPWGYGQRVRVLVMEVE